jgi:hypothetical protein
MLPSKYYVHNIKANLIFASGHGLLCCVTQLLAPIVIQWGGVCVYIHVHACHGDHQNLRWLITPTTILMPYTPVLFKTGW